MIRNSTFQRTTRFTVHRAVTREQRETRRNWSTKNSDESTIRVGEYQACGGRRARALKQTQPYRAVTTLSVRTKPWPRSPTCSPEGFIPIQPSIQPCPTPLSLNLLPTDAVRLSENEQVARIPTSTEVRLNTRAGRSERTPHTLWNRNRTSCLFKGNVHTQPAVASRRCPPSWPST
jgi:hypothetical protein